MSDIKNHSTLTTNLVSYWKLDEASGTREDIHGSNDLTDNNTVTASAGKINDGAVFDGSTEYLSIANNASLSITGAHSFSCWFKADTTVNLKPIFSKWVETSNQRSYALTFEANTLRMIISSNGSVIQGPFGGATLSTGTWYHAVMVFTPSTRAEIFLNGVSDSVITSSVYASVYNSTAPFYIGRANPFGSADNYFDGMVDEFGVWNKALTSSEITDLYNSGNGLPYEAGANNGFLAWL